VTLLKKNILANYAGNIWQGLMGLLFIPLYIKYMGLEAYGLIGVFATIQAMFAVLDLGLSATLTRELARLSALPGKEQQMRNLVRSLEVIYWGIAVLIGLVSYIALPSLASHWIKAGQLPPQTVERALRIMALVMALQWPVALYSGGLLGLQRQILLNVINIFASTVRGVGALLILWLLSPTIEAFFSWQIITFAVQTLLLFSFLWRSVPISDKRATFERQLLLGVWHFAAGMAVFSVTATILTQMDKIILSRILTLEMFGYYTLAGVVAMSLLRLVGPVFSATYPRLTQLASANDQEGLKKLYHKSCQVMSVLILPATVVVAMFSREILLLWTRNAVTTQNTYMLVTILTCGTALNGLMNIPGALLLAHGWTKLVVLTNVIAIGLLAPILYVMARQYGALGGAIVWAVLNLGYVIFTIQFMHRRLLPLEKWRWYREDIGLPLLASLATAGIARLIVGGDMSRVFTMVFLLTVSLLTFAVTAVATETTRSWLLSALRNFRLAYDN
jgi:O-antigen/teichoic acid export membrane protein